MAKLTKRGARTTAGTFLVEGPQAVGEILTHWPDTVEEIFVTPAAREKYSAMLTFGDTLADRDGSRGRRGSSPIVETLVTEAVLAAMADTVNPQGMIAVAQQRRVGLSDVFRTQPRLIAICEQIRDPGNLGTIIRAADATGADAVILTGDTVDPYNPKVVRSTTGSLFHIPVVVDVTLPEVIAAAREAGMSVIAADVKGDDLLEARGTGVLEGRIAWLFGNEARGLDDDALASADGALKLPIFGKAESLNLATAASVCLYETAFAQRTAH